MYTEGTELVSAGLAKRARHKGREASGWQQLIPGSLVLWLAVSLVVLLLQLFSQAGICSLSLWCVLCPCLHVDT